MKRLFRYLPKFFQKKLLKLLYRRNGKRFQDFEVHGNWKFFIYNVNGHFVPSESLGWFVDYDYYEQRLFSMSAFRYKPQEGDVIVDIGAGMGEEAIVFADLVGAKGKIFSLEANPVIFNILNHVLGLNKITNVYTFNKAISDSDRSVTIHVSDTSYLGGTIGHEKSKAEVENFEVEGVRLDTFLANNRIEKVDLLKVNIEGAERYLVNTLDHCLDKIKNIAIECHDFRYAVEKNEFFKTKELLSSYLRKNGFSVSSQHTGTPYIDDWIYAYRQSAK